MMRPDGKKRSDTYGCFVWLSALPAIRREEAATEDCRWISFEAKVAQSSPNPAGRKTLTLSGVGCPSAMVVGLSAGRRRRPRWPCDHHVQPAARNAAGRHGPPATPPRITGRG